MGSSFTFEKMKKDLGNTYMSLICIIVIMLLTTSCSTVPTKQSTSTNTEANSLTTTENAQEELECRYVDATGSRFKRKVCRTKEAWAAISRKNKGEAEDFVRGMDEQSGISTSGGFDSAGGRTNNPTTPPGG